MKKLAIIYGLVIGYLVLDVLFLSYLSLPFYNELIIPGILIGISGLALWFSKDDLIRIVDKNDKFQSLIIVLIIYFICYFLLGLIFGYQRTPYSKEIPSMLSNLWIFVGVMVFQEIIRNSMIRLEKKSMLNFILIVILFVFLNINYSNIGHNFETFKTAFIYLSSVILPLIVTQAVLTYLSYVGGVKFPVVFRCFLIIPELVMPIIPSLNWFATAVVGILLPMATFVYLNYLHIKKTERLSRRASKKYSPVIYIPMFAVMILAAGFVIGVFKYQPIAVMTGSMSPTFNRGDAVVVRKLTEPEKRTLDEGDIIQYISGSKYVIHRIVEVDNDQYGNVVYITKGDYNNTRDLNPVGVNDIVGKVSFSIPYIGYPSVWLSSAI